MVEGAWDLCELYKDNASALLLRIFREFITFIIIIIIVVVVAVVVIVVIIIIQMLPTWLKIQKS